MATRGRGRETGPAVPRNLDVARADDAGDEWAIAFERSIRDVASRAVAHIKRGARVVVSTTAGGSARADRTVGADPLLRYLALLEPVPAPDAPSRAKDAAE